MSFCMKQLVSRILKKLLFSHAQPQRAETRLSQGFVLDSSKSSTYPRGYASGFDSPAALLNGLFEHPVCHTRLLHNLLRIRKLVGVSKCSLPTVAPVSRSKVV